MVSFCLKSPLRANNTPPNVHHVRAGWPSKDKNMVFDLDEPSASIEELPIQPCLSSSFFSHVPLPEHMRRPLRRSNRWHPRRLRHIRSIPRRNSSEANIPSCRSSFEADPIAHLRLCLSLAINISLPIAIPSLSTSCYSSSRPPRLTHLNIPRYRPRARTRRTITRAARRK